MAQPMTYDQHIKAYKAEGLTVMEVPGARGRCRCCPDDVAHRPDGPYIRGWGDIVGQVAHITAGGLGNRTVLKYIEDIINGDPVTPCKSQTVIAPDGVVWVNSAGRCNHAGNVGGSVRAHMIAADFSTTDDFDNRFTGGSADGNAFTYGDECIAVKSMTDDGDQDDMPDDQYDALVRVHAARARFHGWTGQESAGHGEISNQRGFADPNLNMGKTRRDVMARVAGTPNTPDPTPEPEPDPEPSNVAVWGKPETFKLGATGLDVTRLGERIVVWSKHFGLPAPYKKGPSSPLTLTDVKGLSAVQLKFWPGASTKPGGDADGYPGMQTFEMLDREPPAKVATATMVGFNLKSPTLLGKWLTWPFRRVGQVKIITDQNPAVVFIQEAGPPSKVAWYDTELAKHGLVNARAYDKTGSGKWRLIYHDPAIFKRYVGALYTPKPMLDGDTKEVAALIAHEVATGEPWFLASIHGENDNGKDKKTGRDADDIRVDWIKDIFDYMERCRVTYGIKPENVVIQGDTNSDNMVRIWVEKNTDYRDAAKLARVAHDLDQESANGWKPSGRGARIDYFFVHKNTIVNTFDQVDSHKVSDHDAQVINVTI